MKKIWVFVIVGILLLSVITAGATLVFSDAVIPRTPEKPTPETYSGLITFNCGLQRLSVEITSSSMNIDKLVEDAIVSNCDGETTNIRDWTGRTMGQTSDEKIRSFDETKLKIYECTLDNDKDYYQPEDVCLTRQEYDCKMIGMVYDKDVEGCK